MKKSQTRVREPAAPLVRSPWKPYLAKYAGRYALVVAGIAVNLPLSLALVMLVAYAFKQLQSPPGPLAWIDLVGEHASRWLRPWVRGTPYERGLPVEFQSDVFAPALIIVGVTVALLKFMQEWLIEDIGERVARDVRHATFEAYSGLDFPAASRAEGAVISNVVGDDAREIRQALTRLWGAVPGDVAACAMYAGFLCLLDTQLFALLLAILVPAGLVIRVAGKTLKRLARQGLRSQSDLLEALLEKMRGWQTIQVLGGVRRELAGFNVTNDTLLTVWRRSTRAKALASPLVEWLGIVAGAFVIVLALRRIAEGALTSSVLTAFLVTIAQLANSGQSVSSQLNSTRKGTEALRRAHALLVQWCGAERATELVRKRWGAAPEVEVREDVKADVREDAKVDAGKTGRVTDGRIESVSLVGVDLARSGAAEGTRPPLLARGLDLEVRKGDFVVVAGPSGAGKSTLLRVLLGLEPAAAGEVRVNGRVPTEGEWERLARDVAYLPQEPFVVDGTLLENVVFPDALPAASARAGASGAEGGEDAIHARAQEALRRANLAHKDLDARVSGLSGGERQRLMFARAFFRDASLWIVDEATSALDTQNESALLGRLREDAARRLVVTVAHRDSVKSHATRLLALGESPTPESPTARRR